MDGVVDLMVTESASGNMRTVLIKEGAVEEDVVEVDISYDIIRHVSAQLYTNPRKAIEELVCNSYDAGANVCYVTLPADASGSLMVLDNGKSMDLNGLKDLWKVAYSPKDRGEGKPRIENDRMQIGKFGVGKLAAFALGERLTHIACVKGNVRVVSVGQCEIKEKKGGKAPSFKVFRMPLEKAIHFLEPHFADLPRPWEKGWETWTLALVEDIDPRASGRALMIGFLRRMIKTALPISADFKVFLEGEEVPKKEIDPSDIEVRVDITDPELRKKIREALQAFWQDALRRDKPEDVPERYCNLKVDKVQNPQKVSEKVIALIVPELGPIIGDAIITKTSLTTDKLVERGYVNNGFAIRANGKLINPEDELFGVTARSHSYWSRFIANVEIPGLDRVLLVQRNQVSENSDEAQIARTVMRTLFNYTRVKDDEIRKEEREYKPESFGSRLRTLSPLIAPIALSGLAEGTLPEKGLESLDIDFSSLGETGPATRYDPDEQKILVNEDHPLIAALDDLGETSKALRHVVGEVLAGTQMAKGYLRSQSVPEKVVEDTAEIIEVSVRSAAGFVIDEVEYQIKEIDEASYIGGKPFENAVVSAFRSLRLVATRHGGTEEPDGIIEIPVSGAPNLRISVEAKGSKGVITHKELSEATVTRQSDDFNCSHAIAIAREFATEGREKKESALLRETKGKVPLITTAGIACLLNLHKRRPFTYDKVAKILTTWTHPDDLEQFIEQTWKELPDLGLMKLVLQVAHEQMEKDEMNLPEPGMILADDRIRKRKLTRPDLIHVLETIQITTQMILIQNRPEYQFKLLAPCETILEALQRGADDEHASGATGSSSKRSGVERRG
jgi:hypothetical protein